MKAIALAATLCLATAVVAHMGDDRHMMRKREHMIVKQNWVKRRASELRRQIGQASLLLLGSDTPGPQIYNATALWFNQTGTAGSCLFAFSNDDLIMGLPTSLWANDSAVSPYCGQLVAVRNVETGQNATVKVGDYSGVQYTTLSVGAFRALGPNLRIGEINIEYYFLNSTNAEGYNWGVPSSSLISSNSTATDNSTTISGTVPAHAAAAQGTSTLLSATSVGTQTLTINPKPTTTTAPDAASSASAAAAASAASQAAVQAAAQSYQSSVSAAAAASQDAQASKAAQASKDAAASSAAAAAAASSSAAAAAAAKSSEAAKAAASSSAAAAAAASSSAAAAAASSKAAAQAAAASSSSAAAAAASSKAAAKQQAAQAQSTPQSSAPSGGGNWITGGFATYYTQDGTAGACGAYNPDSAMIVAQDSRMYNNGANCGKTVEIVRLSDGATIQAQIADECPGCSTATSLDLSVKAFSLLATQEEGMVAIKYRYV